MSPSFIGTGDRQGAIVAPGNRRDERGHGTDCWDASRHLRANVAGLRRFARVLTGQQRFANLCVVKLIDAVATAPSPVTLASTPKIALFKHLLLIINDPVTAIEFDADIQRTVNGNRLLRQALLLADVEGFAPKGAAEILGVTAECIADVLAQSALVERTSSPARILVIEDEPLISWQIERLVAQLGHELLGVATTRKQAAKLLRTNTPNIVLADVQLADGSTGIDSVTDILAQIKVPVIFVTADPDRLSTGQLVEPVFVVAKPFVPAALKAVISQALFLAADRRQV